MAAENKPTCKITKEMERRAITNASNFFLTESLPENWYEMDESDIDQFIMDHAWEPFECWEADAVFEIIENAAETTLSFLEQEKLTMKRN